MADNIVVRTIRDAIAKLHCNSACYEFLKHKGHHSCWIRWIPYDQQVMTYIKMTVFREMLNQDLVREYLREENDDFIRYYYVLKDQ